MLSKKAKYALQALQHLAKEHEHCPILISELARQERIPKKFLELILLDLKKHGVLQSKKGKGGGYSLRKSPAEINLGYVIRLLDGPLAPLPCVSQTAYMKCQECRDETTCGIRLVMKEVRDATAEILDGTSLADMLNNVARLQVNGKLKKPHKRLAQGRKSRRISKNAMFPTDTRTTSEK